MFKKKDEFSIVDDKEKQKKSNRNFAVGGSIFAFVAVIVMIILISKLYKDFKEKREPKEELNTNFTGTQDFENMKNMYSEMGIEYTEKDYEQDLEAEENGGEKSEATKQVEEKNVGVLDQVKKYNGISMNLNDLKESIIQQTKDMNTFINNHAGFPDPEYNTIEYSYVRSYNDSLIASMADPSKTPENVYEGLYTMEQQKAKMRFSVSKQYQYSVLSVRGEYYEIIANYMAMGHPQFETISSIWVSSPLLEVENGKSETITFDDSSCDLIANIVVDGVYYKVYMCSYRDDQGTQMYRILDIVKKE